MIGVGITTHNRYATFNKCFDSVKRFSKGLKIVVVDDASSLPVPQATFRFEKNVGIARAKNKCFELLDDCDHIFLLDDDVEILKDGWYKPYIESGENHLMYIFQDFQTGPRLNDTEKLYESKRYTAYSHARGCLLYYRHICLEKVGGMDTAFGRWGFEHPELSDRIYNVGLTSFPYMDAVDSAKFVRSLDEHREITSTVWGPERQICIQKNRELYKSMAGRTTFIPYKSAGSAIITYYGNGVPDNQRGVVWPADPSELKDLTSCGLPVVVLTNCLPLGSFENVSYVKAESKINPNMQRWVSYYDYLRKNAHDFVFFTDATDVSCFNNPFPSMKAKTLYVGSEDEKVGCPWMRNHSGWNPLMRQWVRKHAQDVLLNAGLVGGDRDTMLEYLRRMIRLWSDQRGNVGDTDMIPFNIVVREMADNGYKVVTGRQVHTKFKAYEKSSPISWFRHK